jgi:hypothetical protein
MSNLVGMNTIIANLGKYEEKKKINIGYAADITMARAENEMKRQAPWTDRTGMARRMLLGRTEKGKEEVKMFFVHGMDYGKFLELCHFGKYRIIVPVWTSTKNRLFGKLKEMF